MIFLSFTYCPKRIRFNRTSVPTYLYLSVFFRLENARPLSFRHVTRQSCVSTLLSNNLCTDVLTVIVFFFFFRDRVLQTHFHRWGHTPTFDLHLCNKCTSTDICVSFVKRSYKHVFLLGYVRRNNISLDCVRQRRFKEERFPFVRVSILIHRYLSWLVCINVHDTLPSPVHTCNGKNLLIYVRIGMYTVLSWSNRILTK